MTKRIVLGSGKLYVVEGVENDGVYEIPVGIESDENLIGYIQGGATLEYTPEFYEAKDDLGYVSKKMLTEESAILRSGIMTWNGETLAKLSATARVDETVSGKRTVKIGGIGNFDNTQYVIRFVHHDETDGDVKITIVGSNESGFEMAFAKDQETVVNAEFKAVPNDNDGTLIIYEEEDLSVNPKQWIAVDDTQEGYAEMNPHALGWATKHDDEYWLTDDEEPASGVTYYEFKIPE